ncbi:YdeI family protein [Chloroflexota bacterium]
MNIEVALNFKDKQIWRNWLEQNHDKEKEAWLVIFKKHSKKTGLRYDGALEEALCFGWIDGKMRSIDEERFILRYSPRKAKSVWSMINKDKAELLIAQGRMTAAGLAKVEEAKKNGYWYTAYTNKIREVIPSDLKKALMENSTAWNNFEGFANNYQNMYIGWVSCAKTDETRKKRIMEVVKRSALNKKAGIE